MNKPFFYDNKTSQCPENKGCDYAKLKFCTLGNGELHRECSAFKGNVSRNLAPEVELTDSSPLTATVEELLQSNQ